MERAAGDPVTRLVSIDPAINNHAVEQAKGEVILLLNNDIEVI